MKKFCTYCNEERDTENDFHWKDKGRGIRNTRCKFCQSHISKQHYTKNKKSYLDRARAREMLVTEDYRKKLAEHLFCHPCIDCGETDIRTLEFDHVRGKKLHEISKMMSLGCSWSTIEAEIAKCEVRCANCHRNIFNVLFLAILVLIMKTNKNYIPIY